jgi:hypothetical protein
MAKSKRVIHEDGKRWTKITELEHDVVRGRNRKVVLKAGTKNVQIAYRQAPWTFTNEDGEVIRGNLYRYRGKIY